MINEHGKGRLTTRHGVQFDPSVEQAEFNQYWYSSGTIRAMLDEVRHHATACAFLSTPSLYFTLLAGDSSGNMDAESQDKGNIAAGGGVFDQLNAESRLFEFDRQWENEPGFVLYDFHKPDHVPVQHLGAFDYVVGDPPFITEDVWKAYIRTAKLLLKPGGKLLLTTVMENHTMLEGLLDAPLFIAPYRPSIAHLTYQYVCFTNYKPTILAGVNPELPPEDPKIAAAIEMANSLRESEETFRLQMQERNRQGEQPLPTELNQSAATSCAALADIPIETMKWGYVPAGLTVYADGDEMPRPAAPVGAAAAAAAIQTATTHVTDEDYGEAYRDLMTLRETLDDFKRHIDISQRHLIELLRLQQKSATPKSHGSSLQVTVTHTDTAIDAARKQLEETLDKMREMIVQVKLGEARVAPLGSDRVHLRYIATMVECVKKYATVSIDKDALSELAADATRKYKSPVFCRMKELLERVKLIKKQQRQQHQQQLEDQENKNHKSGGRESAEEQ